MPDSEDAKMTAENVQPSTPAQMSVFRVTEDVTWVEVGVDPATKQIPIIDSEYIFALPTQPGERILNFEVSPVPMQPRNIPREEGNALAGYKLMRAYMFRVVFAREGMPFEEFQEMFNMRPHTEVSLQETLNTNDDSQIELPPGVER